MTDKGDEKYRELILDLYKENQTFLNKLILSFSSLAIPLLIRVVQAETVTFALWTYFTSAAVFMIVILTQLVSLRVARDGCDKALSDDESEIERGFRQFNIARNLDLLRDSMFSIGVGLILLGTAFKIFV